MAASGSRPGEVYWSVVEPAWGTVSIYDGPEVFLEQFSKVPQDVGRLFAIHWCVSEICNGGFHQFFHNSTGVLAPEALEGFRAVGLPECATLLKQAMAFFGPDYPRDQAVRVSLLDSYAEQDPTPNEFYLHGWDPFRELNGPFYDALGNDDDNDRFSQRADEFARRLGK